MRASAWSFGCRRFRARACAVYRWKKPSVGEVLEVVLHLAREGMTMLVVTHEIAFARDVSSRVVFMDEGLVAAAGPPAELFAGGIANERLRSFLARFERRY